MNELVGSEINTRTVEECQANFRRYFETGCECILSGKIKKLPPETDDFEATEHYEDHCVCRRGVRHIS